MKRPGSSVPDKFHYETSKPNNGNKESIRYTAVMPFKYDIIWKQAARYLERLLAAATLLAVFWYGIQSAGILLAMDWSSTTTFYTFINRVLISIIGLELVRLLLYHNIGAVLELLAFVIARKMLHPDITSVDVALNSAAFVALMAARHFLMEKYFWETEEDDQ